MDRVRACLVWRVGARVCRMARLDSDRLEVAMEWIAGLLIVAGVFVFVAVFVGVNWLLFHTFKREL